jgi:serine protease
MATKGSCALATACWLCAYLMSLDVAFAGASNTDFVRKDSISSTTTSGPASWSFEVTLASGVVGALAPESLDALIQRIERAALVGMQFAKKSVFGTLIFTSGDILTSAEVAGVRGRISMLEEVESIRTRRLSSARAAAEGAVTATSVAMPAIGFIIKPAANADAAGWIGAAGFTPTAVAKLEELAGVTFAGSFEMAGGMIVLRLGTPVGGAEGTRILSALAGAEFVEWVEPDTLVTVNRVPNDPFYYKQWNLWDTWGINAPAAWDLTIGAPAVVVAVIDTGILKTQPDLSSRILPGYDFITDPSSSRDGDGPDADPSDEGDWHEVGECSSSSFQKSSWHGSHVAGIVGAASNNGYGVAGVAWGIRILPVRVLGRCGGARSDIINGMYWAAGLPVPGAPVNPNPARIINMSLGSRSPKPTCSLDYQTAIQAITSAGAMIVVAAGNNALTTGGEAGFYEPAGCTGVVTVAATDHLGFRSSYSDYSNEFVVDVSAPGGDSNFYHDETVDIYSTVDSGLRGPEGPFGAYYEGTSQATPHVSGTFALMLSANPALTNKQMYWTLIETSREFNSLGVCYRDSVCGWGIVNAHAAVTRALSDPANGPTTVSISSSVNPAIVGEPFTIWASVSPTNVSGTVTFLNNGSPIAGCTSLALASGRIGCTFSNWAPNPAGYPLSYMFNGDYTHHWAYSDVVNQVVYASATPPPGTAWAVEYHHALWDHYFVTDSTTEIAALDGGAFGGVWQRTGQTFLVWPQSAPTLSPTCRFFSTGFPPKSTHFYTPFPSECSGLMSDLNWQFEAIAFYLQLPGVNGLCGGGTMPLYRLFNNLTGGAPNHRYTTSITIFNQMTAAGWTFEGNGTTKVFACVPQAS